jgi:hypothetical protein
MIYALLFNGASAVPLFVPLLPQLLLIYFAVRYFDFDILRNSAAKFYFFAISSFLFFLAIAAGFISELDLFFRLFKLSLNSIFAIFAAVALAGRYGDDFAKVYTGAITKLSLLGIFGLIISSITDWSLVAYIGDRSYHTNLLTVWIADGEVSSSGTNFSPFAYRLQSFFDEPGTFGMFLIPALYFAIYERRAMPIIVLITSIFLTESANAWVGTIILFIIYIFRTSSAIQKLLISSVLLSVLIAFSDVLTTLYEMKMGIDEAYANASSYGTREMEYRYILDNLLSHAAPLSYLGRAHAALPGISSAYVDWAIHGGWVFLFLLFCGLIATGMVFVKIRASACEQSYFPFVLAVTFFISGFQRASVLDNILFMTLFYWSLLAVPRMNGEMRNGEIIEYRRC